MSPPDPRALREAFGTFMTGVTVVTAVDHEDTGLPVGFTANSFTSVSLEPPLVLICVALSSRNIDVFARARGFAVNVLSETQTEISNIFASPVEDRFRDIRWQPGPHGAPILEGGCAWFDCVMHQVVEAGDHLILIGEVKAFEATALAGLGYVRGAYFSLGAQSEMMQMRPNLVVQALIEQAGRLLLLENKSGQLSLPEIRVNREGTLAAIQALLQRLDIGAEPGFIYSIYDDPDTACQYLVFLCQADTDLSASDMFFRAASDTLEKVVDAAQRSVLERFCAEKRYGNFGVYIGNKTEGRVKPL